MTHKQMGVYIIVSLGVAAMACHQTSEADRAEGMNTPAEVDSEQQFHSTDSTETEPPDTEPINEDTDSETDTFTAQSDDTDSVTTLIDTEQTDDTDSAAAVNDTDGLMLPVSIFDCAEQFDTPADIKPFTDFEFLAVEFQRIWDEAITWLDTALLEDCPLEETMNYCRIASYTHEDGYSVEYKRTEIYEDADDDDTYHYYGWWHESSHRVITITNLPKPTPYSSLHIDRYYYAGGDDWSSGDSYKYEAKWSGTLFEDWPPDLAISGEDYQHQTEGDWNYDQQWNNGNCLRSKDWVDWSPERNYFFDDLSVTLDRDVSEELDTRTSADERPTWTGVVFINNRCQGFVDEDSWEIIAPCNEDDL